MSQIRNNTLFEAAVITNLTPYGIFVAHQKWMLVRNSLPHPVPGKAEHWTSLGTKTMQGMEHFKGSGVRFSLDVTCASVEKQNHQRTLLFIQNDSATPFKYSHPSKHFTRIFIEINLGSLIFSNMPLLLFKFGFWSRLPINKWFFPTSRLPLEGSFLWMKGRDVLTVTDTRTICCLISSWAHTHEISVIFKCIYTTQLHIHQVPCAMTSLHTHTHSLGALQWQILWVGS